MLEEGFVSARETDDRALVMSFNRGLARIPAALRTEAGASRQPDEVAFAERMETRLRAELGPEAFALTVSEGTELSQSGAVALALL